MLMSKIGDLDFSLGIRVLMSLIGIYYDLSTERQVSQYRIIMITKKL